MVPFPAGGATDTSARLVAQRLQLRLGQSVIIENQGGAGGTIAAKQVATAAPDGYTLMMASLSTFGTHPLLYKLDYDPHEGVRAGRDGGGRPAGDGGRPVACR